MTRVLALTKYDRAGPSSRVRTYQFLPQFEAAGLEVTVLPLFGDGYVERLYRDGRRDAGGMGRSYLRRLGQLLNPPPHDVVLLEKEAFPWVPAVLESVATARLGPIVADYDDAIFHQYDMNRRGPVRALLGRKIDAVMRRAALVVAGNEYLRVRALKAGARRVEIVPSVVDVPRYQLAGHGTRERPVVGWIGSPGSSYNLELIEGALAELRGREDVIIRLIGATPRDLTALAPEHVTWTEEGEAASLAALDIGVMPLFDDAFQQGKCGYKIIQYMAAGLPVVASAIGANNDIVVEGETGFLVRTQAEWTDALEKLVKDPELRARMGAAGRKRAEEHYSIEAAGKRLAKLLKDVARG